MLQSTQRGGVHFIRAHPKLILQVVWLSVGCSQLLDGNGSTQDLQRNDNTMNCPHAGMLTYIARPDKMYALEALPG